jgi:glycosyltransferase involved in cell wall biosynthesis
MRLLFVVQRYGENVAGGAETACRELATRLAARGHDVEVLTSCALSYVDWANAFPPGSTREDGVEVHRLAVDRPRDPRFFGPLNGRVVWHSSCSPIFLQREWMRSQGPHLPELVPWLARETGRFDVVVFVTYLYATTWSGLPVAAGLAPTVLLPAAHDEPPFWLPLFDLTLRLPSAYAFLTEEEQALVSRRIRTPILSSVIGLGVDLEVTGDPSRFRAAWSLGDRPYLLYVGRLDPGKGSDELADYFTTYKQRRAGDLALAVVGDPVKPLPPHPDIVCTGWVDEQVKADALAGCAALVMPSYFESFSLVLVEAWAHRRPVLVNGRCDVLAGQVRRSGGGLPYRGYAEFEAAVDVMMSDAGRRDVIGERGRTYTEERYRWDRVLAQTERLLETAMRFPRRALGPLTPLEASGSGRG